MISKWWMALVSCSGLVSEKRRFNRKPFLTYHVAWGEEDFASCFLWMFRSELWYEYWLLVQKACLLNALISTENVEDKSLECS